MFINKKLILALVAGAAAWVRAASVTTPWQPVGTTTTNYASGLVSFDGTLTNALPLTVVDANGDVVVEYSLKLSSYAGTNDFPTADLPTSHGVFALAADKPYAYLWDGAAASWQPLNIADGAAAVHAAMPTNILAKLVFILDYSTDGQTRPRYALRLYTNVTEAATSFVSFFVGSVVPAEASGYYMGAQPGVAAAPFATAPTSVTLAGTGAVAADASLVGGLAYQPGGPSIPLSAEIYLCAWSDSEGVWLEFSTEEEAGVKPITIYVKNGSASWVPVATVTPKGTGSNTYRVKAEGLEAGESYYFLIVDEEGQPRELRVPVAVSRFAAKSLKMAANVATLTFGSIAGKAYAIFWKPDLAQTWPETPAVTVRALGSEAVAYVPVASGRSGFFKIMMLADE